MPIVPWVWLCEEAVIAARFCSFFTALTLSFEHLSGLVLAQASATHGGPLCA